MNAAVDTALLAKLECRIILTSVARGEGACVLPGPGGKDSERGLVTKQRLVLTAWERKAAAGGLLRENQSALPLFPAHLLLPCAEVNVSQTTSWFAECSWAL